MLAALREAKGHDARAVFSVAIFARRYPMDKKSGYSCLTFRKKTLVRAENVDHGSLIYKTLTLPKPRLMIRAPYLSPTRTRTSVDVNQ
jgi:hypothetical protein